MKSTHARILAALGQRPGVTYRELAKVTGLPLATVFDNVVAMCRLGLLDYGACPTCGRGMLTPKEGDSDGNETAGLHQDNATRA